MERRWKRLGTWGLLTAVLAGCGSSKGDSPGAGGDAASPAVVTDEREAPEQDFTRVELEYRPDAVALEDVAAVLVHCPSLIYVAVCALLAARHRAPGPRPSTELAIPGV